MRPGSEFQQFFVRNRKLGMEVFYLGADACRETGGIKGLNHTATAAAGEQIGPGCGGAVAHRGDHPDSSNRDSTSRVHADGCRLSRTRAPPIIRFAFLVSIPRTAVSPSHSWTLASHSSRSPGGM